MDRTYLGLCPISTSIGGNEPLGSVTTVLGIINLKTFLVFNFKAFAHP